MTSPKSASGNRFGGYSSQRALAQASAAISTADSPRLHDYADGSLVHITPSGGRVVCREHDREEIRREWYALQRDTPSDRRGWRLGEYLEATVPCCAGGGATCNH